ncbi:MAG: anti-sigma factor [Candidatus Tyrphobacter sp.]
MKPSLPPYARRPVWPAYLVAAVCFALAIVSTLNNLSLTSQLRQVQAQIERSSQRSTMLARTLAVERTALADLENPQAQRYGSANGQIVASNDRLYLLLRNLPMPPHGRVYQAWTQQRGARAMTPSVRFIPDPHGITVVALDQADATHTNAVAVSVEPDSGSKAPTSALVLDVTLGE